MKILDITPITDAAEMPVKKGTLQFLQDAYKETVATTLQALIPNYNPATMYILYGVVNSLADPFYNVSSGAVFYNGEIYLIDSSSFTATGGNTGIFQISTTQYQTDADPVTFTDNVQRNVHNIRKMAVLQGAPGSGLSNFQQAFTCNFKIPIQPIITATGQAVASGAYPNINIDVPVSGNLNPILYAGNIHIGDVPTGGQTYQVTFTTSLPGGTNYFAIGQLMSEGGSPHDDTTAWFTVIRSSMNTSGFQFRLQEGVGVAQSLSIDFIIFKK